MLTQTPARICSRSSRARAENRGVAGLEELRREAQGLARTDRGARRALVVMAVLVAALVSCAGFPRIGRRGPTDAEKREFEAALATARGDPKSGPRAAQRVPVAPSPREPARRMTPSCRWRGSSARAGRPEVAERRLRAVLGGSRQGGSLRRRAARARRDRLRTRRHRRRLEDRASGAGLDAARRRARPTPTASSPISPARAATPPAARNGSAGCAAWCRATTCSRSTREIDGALGGPLARRARRGRGTVSDAASPLAACGSRRRTWRCAAASSTTARHALWRAREVDAAPAEAEQVARLQRRSPRSARRPTRVLRRRRGRGSRAASSAPRPAARGRARIGVVLPFSGPSAKVADDVLRGTLILPPTRSLRRGRTAVGCASWCATAG
jgi:hypothetical protein